MRSGDGREDASRSNEQRRRSSSRVRAAEVDGLALEKQAAKERGKIVLTRSEEEAREVGREEQRRVPNANRGSPSVVRSVRGKKRERRSERELDVSKRRRSFEGRSHVSSDSFDLWGDSGRFCPSRSSRGRGSGGRDVLEVRDLPYRENHLKILEKQPVRTTRESASRKRRRERAEERSRRTSGIITSISLQFGQKLETEKRETSRVKTCYFGRQSRKEDFNVLVVTSAKTIRNEVSNGSTRRIVVVVELHIVTTDDLYDGTKMGSILLGIFRVDIDVVGSEDVAEDVGGKGWEVKNVLEEHRGL